MEREVDLVVIGSGPAGQKGAIQGAKMGKKVIVVEKEPQVGGGCLYSGTIPSKSLRAAILDLTDFYKRSFYAKQAPGGSVSINDLNYRLEKVIFQQRELLEKQFAKNKIEILQGTASFISPTTIELHDRIGKKSCTISAKKFLIATGSSPRNPEAIPFDNERVLDSTRLLNISYLPKRMIVLGGGIIGSEYASFFAALGTEVIVVDKRDRLLPLLDAEIGKKLEEALSGFGLKMLNNKSVSHVERKGESVTVHFSEGDSVTGDCVLYALGRSATVAGLGMEKAGITLDSKGYIPVNALFQTQCTHIYAAGDVIGPPSLASTSMEQGRLAIRQAFGDTIHHFPAIYPMGVYTIPEISSCGYTEEELQKRGFHYEVGRAYYYEIARNQIVGNDPGMFKILFHKETLELLGVHIIGRDATEVIHIGQVAMSFNARIDYFIDQIFNYPTYAEGYRIAALNGWNKVKGKR